MLKKFAVTNYRGFAKRIEFDLSNPSNYTFSQFAIKNGIVKNGIIYGPNGAGKSNLGLAIFDIEYHLSPLKAKKGDYYENFVYAGNAKAMVDFEYIFDFDGQTVDYRYSKDAKGILQKEYLSVDGQQVFSRSGTDLDINPILFPNSGVIQSNFSDNANGVSIVNYLLAFYPMDKNNIVMKLQSFVNGMLWFKGLEVREFIGIESNSSNIEEYIINNDLVSDFQEFLFRMSDQTFEFVQPNDGDTALWYMVGEDKLMFCKTVSTGTTSLELLYFWLKRMDTTTFVFIDEFDAFYHFRLSKNVCQELFKLPCQVFLSSHNTYLMSNDLLRPDCNFVLADGAIKPLSDCTDKELRFGHNIEKLFRGKAFGV